MLAGAGGRHRRAARRARSTSCALAQRRIVLHGTGEQWFEVLAADGRDRAKADATPLCSASSSRACIPALEEASRLSPALRARLEQLVDEVDCSACGGSRLRDDASAVRFRGRTIDELCRLPLGDLLRASSKAGS